MRYVLVLILAMLASPFATFSAAQGGAVDLDGDGIPDEDNNGNGIPDENEIPSGNISQMEIACISYGELRHCLPYHQMYCHGYGFGDACRLASLGQNCLGGDPGACNYYIGLIAANRDCNARFYQPACDWLSQQRF